MPRSPVNASRSTRQAVAVAVAVAVAGALAFALPACGSDDSPPPINAPTSTSAGEATPVTAPAQPATTTPSSLAIPPDGGPIQVDPPITVPGPVTQAELEETHLLFFELTHIYRLRYLDPDEAIRLAQQHGTEHLSIAIQRSTQRIQSPGAHYVIPAPERFQWQGIGRRVSDGQVLYQACLTDGLQMWVNDELIRDDIDQAYFEIATVRTPEGWKLHFYDVWSSNVSEEAATVAEHCP